MHGDIARVFDRIDATIRRRINTLHQDSFDK